MQGVKITGGGLTTPYHVYIYIYMFVFIYAFRYVCIDKNMHYIPRHNINTVVHRRVLFGLHFLGMEWNGAV